MIRGKKGANTQNILDFFLYNFVEQEFMRKDNE